MMFHGGVEGGLFGHTDIALNEIITDSPEASLNNIKSRDINIIMGFFGPENARDTLCLVRNPIIHELRDIDVKVQCNVYSNSLFRWGITSISRVNNFCVYL